MQRGMNSCLKNLQGKPVLSWTTRNVAIELGMEASGSFGEE